VPWYASSRQPPVDLEIACAGPQEFLEHLEIPVFTDPLRGVLCSIGHGFLLVIPVARIIPD
jgi:hypothetical protein